MYWRHCNNYFIKLLLLFNYYNVIIIFARTDNSHQQYVKLNTNSDNNKRINYNKYHIFGQGEYSTTHFKSMSPSYLHSNFTQIPMQLIQQLSNINDVDDFFTKFVDNADDYVHVNNRFGDISVRSAVFRPKQAGCTPELRAVSLTDKDSDPSVIYFPSCTKIERCGGCCGNNLLQCEPTDDGIEIISASVFVTEYRGSGLKLTYKGQEIIPLEKHTKCKCDCRIKEKDCTSFQEYSRADCMCKCKNADDESKCVENHKKFWDPDLCVCRCNDNLECSTGSYFDTETCECIEDQLFTRLSSDHHLSREDIEKIQQERKRFKIQLQTPTPSPDSRLKRRKRTSINNNC